MSILHLFFLTLLGFATTIHSVGYEHGPVECHLNSITFQGRTSDTIAAWEHFKEMFRVYPSADLYPIIDNLLELKDAAIIEWGIAHCARLLFIAPTQRCAQVRTSLLSRITKLNTIIAEADEYIRILEESL